MAKKTRIPPYDKSLLLRVKQRLRQMDDAARSTSKQLDTASGDLRHMVRRLESRSRSRRNAMSSLVRKRRELARRADELEIRLEKRENALYSTKNERDNLAAQAQTHAPELAAARAEIARITQEKTELQTSIRLIDDRVTTMKEKQKLDAERITQKWSQVSALIEAGRVARNTPDPPLPAADAVAVAGGRRTRRSTRRKKRTRPVKRARPTR